MDDNAWRDLRWLTLYALGKLCRYGFLVAGAGVAVGLAGLFLALTHSRLIATCFGAWGLVLTLLGQAYIQFVWNGWLAGKEGKG